MSDHIFVENFEVVAKVGLQESERQSAQSIIIDVHVFRDLKDAGVSDDPRKTSSYTKIRDQIERFVSQKEFKLLEGVAEGISELLLRRPGVQKTVVRIRKKKYGSNPSIGIEITRTRNGL